MKPSAQTVMDERSILRDLVLLFAAALPIVVIFRRLRVPTVLGIDQALARLGIDPATEAPLA